MSTEPDQHGDQAPHDDLTLQQAAAVYDITARTLAQHIRCGQLPAYKTRGPCGREWRVTQAALQAAGYRPRPTRTNTNTDDEPLLVHQLRRQLTAAQRTATAERSRADDLDRRLGHLMLEHGRLQAALRAATNTGESTDGLDLDAETGRRLLTAIKASASAMSR